MEQITIESLRRMEDREGLVLQGCGGDLQEWVDGINEMLTVEGILKNGTRLENVSAFEHDGLTNLLFPFEGAELDMGRLAMWRLQTHEQFGGTWLSDYVPNRLGGFIQEQGTSNIYKDKMLGVRLFGCPAELNTQELAENQTPAQGPGMEWGGFV